MHRRIAGSRASTKSIHKPARSLRQSASLLSTFSPLAGITAKTSRSIKPRELDLRCLRLFFLVQFLTRPTNHPRHAACASNDESKPVRPQNSCAYISTAFAVLCNNPSVPRNAIEWQSK